MNKKVFQPPMTPDQRTEVKKKMQRHEIDQISDNIKNHEKEKSERMINFMRGSGSPMRIQGTSKKIISKSELSENLRNSTPTNYRSNKFNQIIENERKKQIKGYETKTLSQLTLTPNISSTIHKYGFTSKGISRITRGSPSPGRSKQYYRIDNSKSPEALYKKNIPSKRSAKIYTPGPNTTFKKLYRGKNKPDYSNQEQKTEPHRSRTPKERFTKFKNVNWKQSKNQTFIKSNQIGSRYQK